MSTTPEATDGDVPTEPELAAEVTDNDSPRDLIERAAKILDGMNQSEAAIALQHCKDAALWLRRAGI